MKANTVNGTHELCYIYSLEVIC